MQCHVPVKADSLLSLNNEKQTATQAMVALFLDKEENARNEESKTGGLKEEFLSI